MNKKQKLKCLFGFHVYKTGVMLRACLYCNQLEQGSPSLTGRIYCWTSVPFDEMWPRYNPRPGAYYPDDLKLMTELKKNQDD